MLDLLRRQRAAGLYDGSFEPSEVEVKAIIEAATELESHLNKWIEKNHPEWKQESK